MVQPDSPLEFIRSSIHFFILSITQQIKWLLLPGAEYTWKKMQDRVRDRQQIHQLSKKCIIKNCDRHYHSKNLGWRKNNGGVPGGWLTGSAIQAVPEWWVGVIEEKPVGRAPQWREEQVEGLALWGGGSRQI